jgi:hypothetical protein
MKFIYTGHCAKGYVEFRHRDGDVVTMPYGEAVEVPEWLAKKLATNNHFQHAEPDEGETGEFVNNSPPRKKPGPKPKVKPVDESADENRDAD